MGVGNGCAGECNEERWVGEWGCDGVGERHFSDEWWIIWGEEVVGGGRSGEGGVG
jgi:hypothetical protein